MSAAPVATARTSKDWRDLRKRALSAAVLGPAALAGIWLGAAPWTAMIALAIAVLAWEWVHLCGLRTRTLPGAAVPLVVLAACTFSIADEGRLALLVLFLGFVGTWVIAARDVAPTKPPAWLAIGVLYIGLAGIALIELRHDNAAGQANVLFLFLVVWASDSGAYLAGRAFGGPRLAPAISPGKTWSGALGGLLGAMIVGVAVASAMAPGPTGRVMAVAALLGVATQAGDLLESAIKRHFHVKDTSSLIPGHGGLLDRLDGVLAAAPTAALLALFVGYGVVLWQ
ncbi:phosphatidate cytidylyltransferase [Humitalea rosea]|uniref:Phosphatidate cytidylyltransferase n=1 Tax=Humitalea rosea TaxID=990373 RepID=A0A2W7IDA1_9PROT|nr:phosphatidate cytidylyltransferase [Humitalea rosea]PZW43582.1 phosphatidate cytidylyltransferase [Humitalea rosea]